MKKELLDDRPEKRDAILRFNLFVQKGRAGLFLLTVPIFFLARAANVLDAPALPYLVLIAIGIVTAIFFHQLYLRGAGRELPLHRFWMPIDVAIGMASIPLTGGLSSPWYLWQLSGASTAAFVRGRRALIWVCLGNVASYFAILILTGQITGFDQTLALAFFRMTYLYGVGFFLLTGIAHIQEKRMTISQLRAEERHQLEELTRVTKELDRRTRELAEANRKIVDADRAKSQFLANMSHELRTPMNSIIGFSEILMERLGEQISPRYIEFLKHIHSSGEHLLAIINDVLDLSKIEAGKMEIFPETFGIHPVVGGVINIMKGQSTTKERTFLTEIPDDLPQIETELSKFKQILYNLLSNAVKFSAVGSTITISAHANREDDPPSVTVSVRDEGIGIAHENQELVFEEFRQVDGSARRESGGTGLGLALVKRFVELQHGHVDLQSELGRGSVFSVTMPIRYQGTRDSLSTDERSVMTPGERVLVVEDDPIAWDSIRAHLESADYVPIRARHGDEALRLARATHPVAITLDLVLPGVDGWEVLKKLKNDSTTSDIPVVIISMVDHRELGIALGAHDYFLKPVDRTRLLERIRQLVRPVKRKKPTLLVIDDDPHFHEVLAEELGSHGYDLRKAYSGEEGLKLASKDHPEIIILDLMMPGLSGFEVAETLKANRETANIPILVMTAKDLTADDRKQLESRISAVVPKGQSKARLLGALQDLERMRARNADA